MTAQTPGQAASDTEAMLPEWPKDMRYARIRTSLGGCEFHHVEVSVKDGCLVVARFGQVEGMFSPPWQVTT